MQVKDAHNEIQSMKGNFIAFGGHGILDGLKHFCKKSSYKIIGVLPNGDIELKPYSKQKHVILPAYEQDQEFKIFTLDKFKKLPLF